MVSKPSDLGARMLEMSLALAACARGECGFDPLVATCLHPHMKIIPTQAAPSWYAMAKCGDCGRSFEHEETGGWTEVF